MLSSGNRSCCCTSIVIVEIKIETSQSENISMSYIEFLVPCDLIIRMCRGRDMMIN